MKVHVLPGDALTETFQQTALEGEIIVCRECLVEGDAKADTLEIFWQNRARFIENTHGAGEGEYFRGVKNEFEKLQAYAQAESTEINLWFEFELFCQANYWFTLSLLRDGKAKIYRVAPVVLEENKIWKGFGDLSAAQLEECFARRVELSEANLAFGAKLWVAFQTNDHPALESLSTYESAAFPYLTEVCRAALEKQTRPRAVLEEIIADGKTDFAEEIFPAFAAKAGVYGYGDAQVKKILVDTGKWRVDR